MLKEIHDPKIIARKNKRYCVTVDMRLLTPEQGGLKPLPREVTTASDPKTFTIWVGDDIESAQRDDIPVEMWLRFTFAKGVDEKQQIVVELNGQKLGEGRRIDAPTCTTWHFSVDHVGQGKNELRVSVDEIELNDVLRIEGIELVITYTG